MILCDYISLIHSEICKTIYYKTNWNEFKSHMEKITVNASLKTPAEVEEALLNFTKMMIFPDPWKVSEIIVLPVWIQK